MRFLKHTLPVARLAARYLDYLGTSLPLLRKAATTVAGVVVVLEIYCNSADPTDVIVRNGR